MVAKKRKKSSKRVKKEKVLDTIKEQVIDMKIDDKKENIINTEPILNEEKISEPLTWVIKKETLWKYTTFILLAVIIVSTIVFYKTPLICNCNLTNESNSLTGVEKTVTSGSNGVEGDDPAMGSTNAPVTFVVFSDYQCPFSGRFYSDVYPKLKSNFVDKGKVKFVYRDYPLPGHGMAMPAASAADCVREKGGDVAYFKMHDKLFDNQKTLSLEVIKKLTKQLGYDISTCLESNKFKTEINQDTNDGNTLGVQGTPTSFINGKIINGACPYATFETAINAELAGKNWTVDKCVAKVN